ncbi:BZ3500_MvSof-1268-A1-R1_Chr11-1g03270 [Microbotryum saponariae]|uniref:BZ3500_MvSof-1268-A1-R1_Chr11-1g03270 protein n=1 Tax=Microbotryum saponariae TaxID=289078 RepID=A0A2X0L8C5_9BASI|nr:BZ3501_MvSof-1269-A2-R1_Chr11g02845 [Microbotryum saponariae]SDA03853.1 BZ3500_MvSof-1268-A1-R1_Chr11-1g03270 [Microbotryum saponariae]
MSLSAGLTLTDLNDYLAPSQLCIKPVEMVEDTDPHEEDASKLANDPASKADRAKMEIMIDASTLAYYEKASNGTKVKKLKKAEITLNDCLACSGCITSAESVLVQMQSHQEVERTIKERPDLTPIMSISPQSIASLAALHDLSLEDTIKGLRLYFKRQLGFRLVFDTTFARSVSLLENRLEFLERRTHAEQNPAKPSPSVLATSTNSPTSSSTGPLPILSSACPGWICYAEKTHGELLPFVSNVKSPQAMMGTLVKGGRVAKRLGLGPDQIYHVSVMPCYDKKLEASRPDFATPFILDPSSSSAKAPTSPVRDVDCVLTTGEVNTMITASGTNLSRLAKESADSGASESEYFPSTLLSPRSSDPSTSTSSGGYFQNAILAILSNLPPETYPELHVDLKRLRNDNSVQSTLYRKDRVLVKVAKSYGLHNLHTIVKKLGREFGISVSAGAAGRAPPSMRGGSGYGSKTKVGVGKEKERDVEFIEVMACPSGCLNGGGQIPTPSNSAAARRWEVDQEGMPDVALTQMKEEERDGMDLDGGGEDRKVLSSVEWVNKVEQKYWSVSSMSPPAPPSDKEANLDPSIVPYIRHLRDLQEEEKEVRACLEELVEGGGSERRKELLRTSYRALEKEETNGLAVVW